MKCDTFIWNNELFATCLDLPSPSLRLRVVSPELLPAALNFSLNYWMNLPFGFDEFVARDRKTVASSFRQVAPRKKLTSSLTDADVTDHGKTSHALLASLFFRLFISGRLRRPARTQTDFIRNSKSRPTLKESIIFIRVHFMTYSSFFYVLLFSIIIDF